MFGQIPRMFRRAAGLCAAAMLSIGQADGATFTVSSTADSGAGTLRQAVIDSNTVGGADIINFSAVPFNIPQTISLTSGELAISGALTIDGSVAPLTISGNNSSRIFNINGAGTLAVTL